MHIENLLAFSQLNQFNQFNQISSLHFPLPDLKTSSLVSWWCIDCKVVKHLQSKNPEHREIQRNLFCPLFGSLLWKLLCISPWCGQLKGSLCWVTLDECWRSFGHSMGVRDGLIKKVFNEKIEWDLKYLVRLCKTERQLMMQLIHLGYRTALLAVCV